MANHPKAFRHVGLLSIEPLGTAGLLTNWSSDNFAGESRSLASRTSSTGIVRGAGAKAMRRHQDLAYSSSRIAKRMHSAAYGMASSRVWGICSPHVPQRS